MRRHNGFIRWAWDGTILKCPKRFFIIFPFSKLWTDQKQGHPLTSSIISSGLLRDCHRIPRENGIPCVQTTPFLHLFLRVSMSYIHIYIHIIIYPDIIQWVVFLFIRFFPKQPVHWKVTGSPEIILRLRILWSLRPQQQELLRDFLPAPSSSIRIEVKNHWKRILVAASFFMMYVYDIYIYIICMYIYIYVRETFLYYLTALLICILKKIK